MNFIYITLSVVVVVQFSLQNVIKSENQNRIYKGSTAEPHSAPYMVLLVIKLGNSTSVCGGSLIKPKFVLTAGHCLKRALSFKVFIGANSMFQAYLDKNWVDILSYRIHRQFNPFNLKNDIAIITLLLPVVLSNKIALVQLPKKSVVSSLAGKYGRLTGYGAISDDTLQMNDVLKELKVRIVRNENCRGLPITPTHICAYGDDSGNACIGDSGGPLILENTNIQVGITSYGSVLGCTKGYPHVYVNVALYLNWIKTWSK